MPVISESRLAELRFIDGVEKVEHVPYSTGDQFWVRFNRPLDFKKLNALLKKRGYVIIKFGGLPSKLPRGLSEILWDGVNHVIVKKLGGLTKLTAKLGLEPEGVAKIATDLHNSNQIFMATNEEGIQLLYDYLGLKYVPPPPPTPKPAAPAKPAVPAAKPPTPTPATAPKPATPAPSPAATPAATPAAPQAAQSGVKPFTPTIPVQKKPAAPSPTPSKNPETEEKTTSN